MRRAQCRRRTGLRPEGRDDRTNTTSGGTPIVCPADRAPSSESKGNEELFQFATHCADYLRLRPATVTAYSSDAGLTARWLAEHRGITALSEADTDDLRTYIHSLSHLKNATVARRVRSLSAFFQFLLQVGAITEALTDNLRAPKVCDVRIML